MNELDARCEILCSEYRGSSCTVGPDESKITLYYATPEQAERAYAVLVDMVDRGYSLARERRA